VGDLAAGARLAGQQTTRSESAFGAPLIQRHCVLCCGQRHHRVKVQRFAKPRPGAKNATERSVSRLVQGKGPQTRAAAVISAPPAPVSHGIAMGNP
jgi:hypothetical protein